MVVLPRAYWRNYEELVTDLGDYLSRAQSLVATWPDKTFVWRGMRKADHALHSSLYWRAVSGWGDLPEGRVDRRLSFSRIEKDVFDDARRWGLQRNATDRLSALELLAALQHQGVPTRLLDFTHNALVALWFAVGDSDYEHARGEPEPDGRIIVAESTGREIPEAWARDPDLPWLAGAPHDWKSNIFVWTPPPIDPRISRQQGCFVFGGVPTTTGGWWINDNGRSRPLRAEEIRACVSVPIRLNKVVYIERTADRGRIPRYPLAFTLLVPQVCKRALRQQLADVFGYEHAMMYPDYPGFHRFSRVIPRTS